MNNNDTPHITRENEPNIPLILETLLRLSAESACQRLYGDPHAIIVTPVRTRKRTPDDPPGIFLRVD